MRRTNPFRIIACGLLLCLSCFAQEAKPHSAPMHTAVMEALLQSRLPGGIEENLGCSDIPNVSYEITTGDAETSLRSIPQTDNVTLTWSKTTSAYRVVIKEEGITPQIASITVPEKVIEAASLSYAVDVLLLDPLVSTQVAKLHFEELSRDVGFASMLEGKKRSISIPAGRLDDALDAIARSFGPAVWQITERSCGERKTFKAEWVVR